MKFTSDRLLSIITDRPLAQKLLIIAVMPIFVMVILFLHKDIDTIHQMWQMQRLKTDIELSSRLSDLVHNLQKERGLASGYLGSDGSKFHQLQQQQTNSDEAFIRLKSFLAAHPDLRSRPYYPKLSETLNRLANIENFRHQITNKQITFHKVIDYYSGFNQAFIGTIRAIGKQNRDTALMQQTLAYVSLLFAKEQMGKVRAYGTYILAHRTLGPEDISTLKSFETREDFFLDTFREFADPESITLFQKLTHTPDFLHFSEMEKRLIEKGQRADFDAPQWYQAATKAIDLFQQIEQKSEQILRKRVEENYDRARLFLLFYILSSLVIFGIIALLSFVLIRQMKKNFTTIQVSIDHFIAFLNKETSHIPKVEVVGKDEFYHIATSINTQAKRLSQNFVQDQKVLREIDDVVQKVQMGYFGYTITKKASTTEIERLRENINTMIVDTKQKLDLLTTMFFHYGKNRFDYRLTKEEMEGMNGEFGSLLNAVILQGDNISELLAMMQNAGDCLDQNTGELSKATQKLNQNAQIEKEVILETTRNLQTLYEKLISYNDQIKQMDSLSVTLEQTALEGKSKAEKSAASMEEIDTKVAAIEEAIGIIEQIAFQTNILSLNAAVEAATAGEAGKGFAVVANEVRNLATKSAKAAHTIKHLVTEANERTRIGRENSEEMIIGYQALYRSVTQTKEAISQVTLLSKNQESTIEEMGRGIEKIEKSSRGNTQTVTYISRLAEDTDKLSKKLLQIAHTATFDPAFKAQVCDIELSRMITQMKNDHIHFKNGILKRVGTKSHFSVVDSRSCRLGKWMIEQERLNRPFTKTKTWERLQERHQEIHIHAQEYVTQNANNADNAKLKKIGEDIDQATLSIFSALNGLKQEFCEHFYHAEEEQVLCEV